MTSTTTLETTAAEINHIDHHHGVSDEDHAEEYHLHVHYVLFTSWWYIGGLAIAELVIYLITLLMIRWMTITRSRQKRSHFTWRYSGSTTLHV